MDDRFTNHIWKSLRSKTNNLLGDDFWKDLTDILPNKGPRMDTFQKDSILNIFVELPGNLNSDSIHLSIIEHTLYIKGDIPYPYDVDPDQLEYAERALGSFERKVVMPSDQWVESVKTNYDNGLLCIEIKLNNYSNEPIHIDVKDLAKKREDHHGTN
jgi:HSP20 family protein